MGHETKAPSKPRVQLTMQDALRRTLIILGRLDATARARLLRMLVELEGG